MPKLRNLEVVEVSFVPRGANRKKFFLIKQMMEVKKLEEVIKEILEMELDNEEKIDEVLKKAELSEKARNAVKGALKILVAYKDELPKDILKTLADLAGYEYAEPEEYPEPGTKKEKEKKMDENIPPEIKAKLEALWKEKEELRKALEAEIEQRKIREYIAKAEEFKNLPTNPQELGLILKNIAEKLPEDYEKIERLLKAADECIKSSEIFSEKGSSLGGTSDVWKKIEALAESYIQKDGRLTKEQAIAKVLEENPELYKEYKKAR